MQQEPKGSVMLLPDKEILTTRMQHTFDQDGSVDLRMSTSSSTNISVQDRFQ